DGARSFEQDEATHRIDEQSDRLDVGRVAKGARTRESKAPHIAVVDDRRAVRILHVRRDRRAIAATRYDEIEKLCRRRFDAAIKADARLRTIIGRAIDELRIDRFRGRLST